MWQLRFGSLRGRAVLFEVAFIGLMVGFVLSDPMSPLALAIMMSGLALAVLARRLTCPKCKRPAFERRVRLFGYQWVIVGAPVPPRCASCGLDFTQQPPDTGAYSEGRASDPWPAGKVGVALLACAGASTVGAMLGWWHGHRRLALAALGVAMMWAAAGIVCHRRSKRARRSRPSRRH